MSPTHHPAIKACTLAALAAAALSLSGCADMLNIGSAEYSCPGLPTGVRCLSARDVYAETNSRDHVDGRGGAEPKKSTTEAPATDLAATSVTASAPASPAIPTVKTVPIRTAAKVMRIWVAPWEDEVGFFHGSEYVFAEIEGRKWALSDGQVFAGKRTGSGAGGKVDAMQRLITPLK
jgi:conjugal transfer pilus assembly protein TraV